MDFRTLYIVGNGFDLHHFLPTKYEHFKNYLKATDWEIYNWVDLYVPAEHDWSDLELALAYLDSDNVVSDQASFLGSYADENWSDSGHHDFQYEVDRIATGLSRSLQEHFGDWIRSIAVPHRRVVEDRLVKLESDAFFLTFNYTSTLTDLYDVPPEDILYIHGEGADKCAKLVLGHAWTADERASVCKQHDDEDADHRILEALGVLDAYFDETFKPSAKIIEQNADFFSGLSSATKVVVLGHSLSEVDSAYFLALVEALQGQPSWLVAVRPEDDVAGKMLSLLTYGVPLENISCKLWVEL
ncbi:bacteriophage abortive infection AbiH family protein [Pseudomonas jessenii]|uniref:Abortive infection AbiH-like protein n=1 Tax=Pseudomonas jessenii TaxID=77298 RepID=A0A370S907_PSEJE|nr:bacteriophage abortive infection AbiH family protein [Pseudomonas jessenii]RDL16215.1 abortive infection AbiH-like protein [Pseudomonas jessenii]